MKKLLIPRRDLIIGGAALGLGLTLPRQAYAAGKTMWGWSTSPGNGTNTATQYSAPVQIGTSSTAWNQIAGIGQPFGAVKTDGTLWTWGAGYLGGTGQNNTLSLSSPVQLGALTTWASVAMGWFLGAAIKTDGTLWTWGRGTYGALGSGAITTRSSPVQVGALTNWSKIWCGYSAMAAIKTDGTLWTWGKNANGQLGLGNTTNYSSPVQVGLLTNWSKVVGISSKSGATMGALKTDGTIWLWGNGANGQLGRGNLTSYSSPVQLGANTDWLDLAIGLGSAMGIRGTGGQGSLWQWGGLNYGDGPAPSNSSPVQLGAATDWTACFKTSETSFGIRAPGKLFAWGRNSGTNLGTNSALATSSPIQVGSATTWLSVAAGAANGSGAYGVVGLQSAPAASTAHGTFLNLMGAGR